MDMSFSDLARINDCKYAEHLTTLSHSQEAALADDSTLLVYFYLLLNGWKAGRIAHRFALDKPRQTRLMVALRPWAYWNIILNDSGEQL